VVRAVAWIWPMRGSEITPRPGTRSRIFDSSSTSKTEISSRSPVPTGRSFSSLDRAACSISRRLSAAALPAPASLGGRAGSGARSARVTAPAGLAEDGGLVFLAPEEPLAPRLELPFATAEGFLHHHLAPTSARVGAGLMLDNFLDMAHFPFVHAATIGSDEVSRGTETAGSPVLGDDVFVGPGAAIFGPVELGDRVEVGANAVVRSSFGSDVVVAGVPARVVRKVT